ncbi:MarR family winged helix-turn-helix transcriptional regulator [Roseovarius sp. ZX-A-9]|uniref:MarR family winged helix-turn-helix transcriptional regulator n=1 Tax=Roseovarius sp. ZX-A-9 TaxID=3014783 RepID=UPI002330CB7D|nr:MarR family transcriptional regulator [Roseovarius sp. ZX-A-9]
MENPTHSQTAGKNGQDRDEFLDLLAPMMAGPVVARDAYRMSLWSNFFNGPVYKQLQKTHGLVRDEVNTLFCLAHLDDLNQRDICLVMGRPKNSVSRAIARLVERDLIEARGDPGDRRRAKLRLKPKGRALYETTSRLFVEREAKMLASLTPREREQLGAILTKLMESHHEWSELY